MKKVFRISIVLGIGLMIMTLYAATAPVLDRQLLVDKEFQYGVQMSAAILSFKPNGTYTASFSSGAKSWYNEGAYTLAGSTVTLTPVQCLSHEGGRTIPCSESLGAAMCTIKEAGDNLHFARFLSCRSPNRQPLGVGTSVIDFYHDGFRLPAGTERKWQGVPVVTTGNQFGVTTTAVKIRKAPSVTAAVVPFSPGPQKKGDASAVPAGTDVVIVARTKDRQTVDTWNNYWYLVSVGPIDLVWMFGEFVKLK